MKIRKCKYNFGNNNDGVFSTINGYATETNNFGETAVGILNKSTLDPDTFTSPDVVTSSKATLFSVGNGSDNVRKNAFEIKANGDTYINGVGGYDGTNSGEATSIADEFQGIRDDISKITGIDEALLDNKVDWQENKTSIYLPVNGSITALRNDGQGGGVLICQRSYDDEATYVTEVGTTMNNLTLNSIERPKIDFADGTSQNIAYESEITDISSSLDNYLPLTGGTLTGSLNVNSGVYSNYGFIHDDFVLKGRSNHAQIYLQSFVQDSTSTDILAIYNAYNNKIFGFSSTGISMYNGKDDELFNTAGGTISIDDLKTQLGVPDTSNLATKDELSGYLPLTGGTIKNSTEGSSKITMSADSTNQDYISITDTSGVGIAVYGPTGVTIYNKKQTDLLNATGGTLSADDIALNTVATYAGKANGLASLNDTGKIPESQLPSYVDDVVEYDSLTSFPETGESGKIYIAADTNMTYRWSGSSYVAISSSLALGETSSTAYAGDKGKANRDAIESLPSHIVSNIYNFFTTENKIAISFDLLSKDGLGYGDQTTDDIELNAATSSSAGVMSASDKQKLDGLSNYTLPIASTTSLGGVRVGDGLEITEEGVLNCTIDPGSGTVSWGNIQGKPTFATVATSGLYSDLTGTPDLSGYVTSTQLTSVAGSNTYTGANYISKETNLTDAVMQLDEEIKAANDNIDLEHANAEAAYVKKAGDTMTGTLFGNSLSFSGAMILGKGNASLTSLENGPLVINAGDTSRLINIVPIGVGGDIVSIGFGGMNLPGKDSSDILTGAGNTTKLKTINSQSLLGEGNIEIQVEGGGVTDAPSDGKLYGRKNAQWTEVTVPDTSNFATKDELDDKADLSGAQFEGAIAASQLQVSTADQGIVYGVIAQTNDVLFRTLNAGIDSVTFQIQSVTPLKITESGIMENGTYLENKYAKITDIPSLSGYATESYVDSKVAGLVDSAPETLDTLNELAAALGDDPNFATTITTQLGNKVDTSTYNSDKATFALKSELPDMSNYALKSELPSVESITTTDIDALFS